MPLPAARLQDVEFITAGDESAVLMSLSTQGPLAQKQLSSLCDAMQQELPALCGARVSSQAYPAATAGWGEPSLNYAVGGRSYRVSAGAFFQVNRFLVAPLLEAVTAGRSGGVAWDLSAGVGRFAGALRERFERVIAGESSPLATPDLRTNLRGGDHQCVSADALQFLHAQTGRKQRQQAGVADLVVVDPPRAGLGAEFCRLLGSARPLRIVYVSCDPATLARDLHALQLAGYRLAEVTLVDLFPQTFHLESVAVLERV